MGVDQAIEITAAERNTVLALLKKHLPGAAAWVYGSRARSTSRPQSDLDIVVFPTPEQRRRVGDLREAFDESNLPFRVDLFVWDEVPESFRPQIEAEHAELIPRSSERAILDWRKTRWGDIATLEYGRALRGYANGKGSFRVFGTNGPIGWHHEALYEHPSVIVGRKGAYRGIHYSADPFFAIDTAFYLKPIEEMDLRWAFYALLTQDINGMDSGSAIPSTSREEFYCLPVSLPPLAEQRNIAQILGTLDDKIELNRRMNTTLEGMARALFKSWFVDFDPVRAKMEGRDPGLPEDIADLFPDRLVDSELGEIPKEWLVESLGKHFEAVKGVSYKGSGLSGDGVPLHNLNSVLEGGGYKYEGIKFYTGEYKERHRVRPGDVIVANTEQGHGRLLIGFAAIAPAAYGTDGVASHHLFRLRSRRASWLSTRFVLFLLNSGRMHDIVSGYANGTTVNMLPIDGVQRPLFAVPPRALTETFDLVVSCAENRREYAVRESRILTVVRDSLLPRLVSGEVRVNELETPRWPTDSSARGEAKKA